MKNTVNFFWIVVIGAIITAGLMGCNSTPSIDEATLAKYENASWTVTPLAGSPVSLNGFREIGKDEIIYFENISLTQDFDENTTYALTSPEFPGAFYYLRYGLVLFQGKTLFGNKSTTIDEDTFAAMNDYTNNFHSASWAAKLLPAPPPLAGFERLGALNAEALAFAGISLRDEEGNWLESNRWYEITAPELPGITYLYNRSGGTVSTASIYKRGN